MGSVFLTHLHSAWHVDQAIMHEETRLVVMRFGSDSDPDCMAMVRRSPAPSSPFPT
jgi:DIM1 family U5 snRNP protein